MQKFIFGIYGTKNAKTGRQLTAEKFDSNGKHTPMEEREEFMEENVLECLAGEVEDLTDYLNGGA